MSDYILIVEDSAIQAEMLRRLLVKEGYDVIIARDGKEGIEAAERHKPNLILSDINMPVMDGYEMCSKIKQDEALKDIPLILLTQLFEPEEVLKGLESGGDAYITKPYKEDYLLSMVKVTIENPSGFINNPALRSVEFEYHGKRYSVHSSRAQTLSYLISSYESTLMQNMELIRTQEQLKLLNETLDEKVNERTAALRDEFIKVKEAQKEIEFKSFLLDNALDSIFVIDLEGNLIYANEAAWKTRGYAKEEFLKMSVQKLDTPEYAGMVKARIESLLNKGSAAFESAHLRKDGSVMPVEISARTIETDGRKVIISIIRDISERKKLDELLREYSLSLEEEVKSRTMELEDANLKLGSVNRELEAFTYSASHDLKAPLRSIDGFSKVLLEDYSERLDEDGRNYLSRVRAASQKMAELIDDLLNLSRLSRAEINKQTIDLSGIVNGIAAELRQAEHERKVDFVIAEGMRADADEHLIRIALENLLRNAWKFTSKKPSARIEVGISEDTERKTEYFVKDNGAGFDMTYAEKLFKPFQRLHSPEEFAGSGVGLTIVSRIIHRHGGNVRAEGKPDEGATFYFTLPKKI